MEKERGRCGRVSKICATGAVDRSRSPRNQISTPFESVQHSSSPVNLRGRSPNKSGKEPLRPPPPKRASSQPLSSAPAKGLLGRLLLPARLRSLLQTPKQIRLPHRVFDQELLRQKLGQLQPHQVSLNSLVKHLLATFPVRHHPGTWRSKLLVERHP